MKKKNIFLVALALLGLTSCNDYLDVDSPSKFSQDFIFSDVDEASSMLNGVYQALCNNNTYGHGMYTTFGLNSDVEWTPASNETQVASHNEYKAFDCEADASNLLSMWNAAYATIERANDFIHGAERSKIVEDLSETNADKRAQMLQMIGEAKCLRAMNYFDMTILMGDIPFSLIRAYDADNLVFPIVDRDEIQRLLIEDLKSAAENMKSSKDMKTVERPTKEFAWALIARIALFRGGYSLRHGDSTTELGEMKRPNDWKDYIAIAREYSKKVIDEQTHKLTKNWFDVFIDECNYVVNYNDDPIFEIPFTINVSGDWGYRTGIAYNLTSTIGETWGKTRGTDIRLNAFHRYTYDRDDLRLNAIGYWTYENRTPTLMRNQRYNTSLKWSKLWDKSARMSVDAEGGTGINFPYMRYADVLLMFAEAENELNGPTDLAKDALKQVRERAFRGTANIGTTVDAYCNETDKDAFFKKIQNERAWEFAGEGTRWRDLVRWNIYNQVIYKQFWLYYGVATQDDNLAPDYWKYPKDIIYKTVRANDPMADPNFPNKSLGQIVFYKNDTYGYDNKWSSMRDYESKEDGTGERDIMNAEIEATGSGWTRALTSWFTWETSDGLPQPDCRLSVRGYIYTDESGNLYPAGMPQYNNDDVLNRLPVLRYILPIPRDAISRSNGTYKNYYGY